MEHITNNQKYGEAPGLVANWIDEIVLPELADGTRSAEKIVSLLESEARWNLAVEMTDSNAYELNSDTALYHSWIVTGNHNEILAAYIREAMNKSEVNKR
jgi:hypothetical protein